MDGKIIAVKWNVTLIQEKKFNIDQEVAKDPCQPNFRQVYLIHSELHDELKEKGVDILPGQMGENITTGRYGKLRAYSLKA